MSIEFGLGHVEFRWWYVSPTLRFEPLSPSLVAPWC